MVLPVCFPETPEDYGTPGRSVADAVGKVDEGDHCQICLRKGLEFVAGQAFLLHDSVERFHVGVLVRHSIRYPLVLEL